MISLLKGCLRDCGGFVRSAIGQSDSVLVLPMTTVLIEAPRLKLSNALAPYFPLGEFTKVWEHVLASEIGQRNVTASVFSKAMGTCGEHSSLFGV